MWLGTKPSNIALIKYMGKRDIAFNKPSNASFSWTLPHLKTQVTLTISDKPLDTWSPLQTDFPFEMSSTGLQKYLNHLNRIKELFSVKKFFEVKSGNNFPADCGIASSASSFAALTEAACAACAEISGEENLSLLDQAKLSALGSGSSCRSFLPNWVCWDGEEIRPVSTAYDELLHMVVIVASGAKKISSSQAHKRVSSSLLFEGRTHRAEQRLGDFIKNANRKGWMQLYEIAWAEFWDMHALFETSTPSFGYFEPQTLTILNLARDFWFSQGDGPLVTMDAGPNVHLLWREDQRNQALDFFNESLKGQWACLSNMVEIGFAKL